MQPFPKIPNAELFLVGGCVRDTLMNLPVKDRDFVVITKESFPEFVKTLQNMDNVTVFQTRPEYFTVRALFDNEPIDLVFPRTESGYFDGRHPQNVQGIDGLEVTGDILREDALRRDFTMNALFMSEAGEILDFFGGRDDILLNRITAVGTPLDRFKEDSLRILRGIRFVCKLGFELDPVTDAAMFASAPLLENISAERIREELSQAMLHNPARAFFYLNTYGIFDMLKAKGITFDVTMKRRI